MQESCFPGPHHGSSQQGREFPNCSVIECLVTSELDNGVQGLRNVLLWTVKARFQRAPGLLQVVYVIHENFDAAGQALLLEAATH